MINGSRMFSACLPREAQCYIRCLVFGLTTLISLSSFASVQIGNTEQDLAALSGMSEQIRRIPNSTIAAFETILDAGQLPTLFKTLNIVELRDALGQSFTEDKFNRQLLSQLRHQLNAHERDQLIRWYESPLGHRIKQAELDYSLLTSGSEFVLYQQTLEIDSIDPQRLQLIRQLDKTMQTTTSAVDMMTSMQVAFNVSLSQALPPERQLSIEQLLAMAEQQKPDLYALYRKQSQALLLYMYQSFSDAELLVLERELASVAGQKFVNAVNLSIQTALFNASQELGQRLADMLEAVEPEKVEI
jgi:hypothetical protein